MVPRSRTTRQRRDARGALDRKAEPMPQGTAQAAIVEAQRIAKAAESEGRDFTPTERAQVAGLFAEARQLKAADEAAGAASLRSQVDELGRGPAGRAGPGHSLGGGRASFGGPGSWGKAWADRAEKTGHKDALTPSGTITVPILSEGIAPLEDRPASFLQAISFVPLDPSDAFAYTRQTVQGFDGATVLPGHKKPTSDVELVKVQDRARYVAHMVGPINRSTIADTPEVQLFLDDVMLLGVIRALEHVVLHGDATDATHDDFNGLYNTSGVRAQAFAIDALTSIRKGITTLEKARLTGPKLVIMNAQSWENLELTKSTEKFIMGDAGGIGQRQLPVDTARQGVWGQRVAITEAMADNEVVVGDFSDVSIRIRERETANIRWSEGTQELIQDGGSGGATASAFELNQVRFLAEGRYGLELRRPQAFCLVATA
jgi:HK97 family phage major capsid protein